MEGPLERTVRQAIKDKAPDLYRSLASSKELDQFVYVGAVEVNREVQSLRKEEKWDDLPHLELIQRLNTARVRAVDTVVDKLGELRAVA